MGNKLPFSLHKSHLILKNKFLPSEGHLIAQCTEVRFASFFSGEFIFTAIVVNPPDKTKRFLCNVSYQSICIRIGEVGQPNILIPLITRTKVVSST